MNDPQPEGHMASYIVLATLLGGVAGGARRSCAVDDAANSSDDSEPAADRDGAREA